MNLNSSQVENVDTLEYFDEISEFTHEQMKKLLECCGDEGTHVVPENLGTFKEFEEWLRGV